MDIKISELTLPTQSVKPVSAGQTEGDFKFTLISQIEETELKEKLGHMLDEITSQGQLIAKKRDIRDMKRYRGLIKGFLNEVVTRSHSFSRQNFLDRQGRHRVYGIIKQIDDDLDQLAQELVKDEKDNISILDRIDEIKGLILDIFT